MSDCSFTQRVLNILFEHTLAVVQCCRFQLTLAVVQCCRFGHTLIPRSLPMAPNRRVLLRELFFKPYEARDNLDSLAAGLIQSAHPEDRSQPPDQFCVSEVTSHLFENQEGVRKGFDLVSLNIQRGRDHGLPSYNSFRKALGLRPVTTFADPALGTAGADLAKVYA